MLECKRADDFSLLVLDEWLGNIWNDLTHTQKCTNKSGDNTETHTYIYIEIKYKQILLLVFSSLDFQFNFSAFEILDASESRKYQKTYVCIQQDDR